jgi:hypothetical protein
MPSPSNGAVKWRFSHCSGRQQPQLIALGAISAAITRRGISWGVGGHFTPDRASSGRLRCRPRAIPSPCGRGPNVRQAAVFRPRPARTGGKPRSPSSGARSSARSTGRWHSASSPTARVRHCRARIGAGCARDDARRCELALGVALDAVTGWARSWLSGLSRHYPESRGNSLHSPPCGCSPS